MARTHKPSPPGTEGLAAGESASSGRSRHVEERDGGGGASELEVERMVVVAFPREMVIAFSMAFVESVWQAEYGVPMLSIYLPR